MENGNTQTGKKVFNTILRKLSKPKSSYPMEIKSTDDMLGPHPAFKKRFRAVVLGETGVGKTSIINRFLRKKFEMKHVPTIDEVHCADLNCGMINHFQLELLDTSGTHEFPAMRELAILSGDSFILVYSKSDHKSFERLVKLRQEIYSLKKNDSVPMVIVANKIDEVEEENTDDMKVLTEWNHAYVKTSAKDNLNVKVIFKELFLQANMPYSMSPPLKRRRALPDYCATLISKISIPKK